MKFKPLLGVLCTAALLTVPTVSVFANNSDSEDMYRLYNPNSGEHFYTATPKEKDDLVAAGWSYEGIGWTAPTELSSITDTEPVYRLYNPNAGDHFYTPDFTERLQLINDGWSDEGIGWYSAKDQEVPLYREYNPNCQSAGSHNFTTNKKENDDLVNAGWQAEGYAWYGISADAAKENPATVTDQGWSVITPRYGSKYLSVGAKIQNPNPSQNITATVTLTSYRADGSILDVSTTPVCLPANTTIPVGKTFPETTNEDPDHVTVTVSTDSYTSSNAFMINPSNYQITNVTDTQSPTTGILNITGTITNNSDAAANYAYLIAIFYDNNGKIIGGDRDILNTINAHSSTNFSANYYETPNYASRDLAVIN